MTPLVTKAGPLDMQVCVPEEWTDAEVIEFAERRNPCGTELGWQIRKEGSELLKGDPERAPCSMNAYYVHIMLDA